MQVLPEADECFLCDVFRITDRADEPAGQPVNEALVPFHQLAERRTVACDGFRDDVLI